MANTKYAQWYHISALFVFFVFVLYTAKPLLLPIFICVLMALLLNPAVSFLERFFFPRFVSTIILITCLFIPLTWLSVELSEPVHRWAKVLPEYSKILDEQIESINQTLNEQLDGQEPVIEKKESSWFGWFDDEEEKVKDDNVLDAKSVTDSIKETTLNAFIDGVSAAPVVLAQIAAGAVLLVFILSFSPSLFFAYTQRLDVAQRRKALVLKGRIQKELSTYVVLVTLINFILGASAALCFYLFGLKDPLLWGSVVGLLNFIPYIGMMIGVCLIGLASVVQFELTLVAWVPLIIYLLLNLFESQFFTPMLMSHRMSLNPLILLLWLAFWGWLWGIVGLLIALPLLVCLKIGLSFTEFGKHWLPVIEAKG
ncbi:AI-2E family transporter [Glaciecola sp. 1036]|uniref:AI-2E family transporter n=1 Tax=Alteromonadaceae TaxID=72275 RepID=UPI003CFD2A72